MNAIIKDNIPYCSKCEIPLSKMTGEFGLSEYENKKYYRFERYCDNCRGRYTYYADITIDNTTRYSFNNVKEVKEDEIKR